MQVSWTYHLREQAVQSPPVTLPLWATIQNMQDATLPGAPAKSEVPHR